MQTNLISEVLTNTVSVTTHLTPQAVAYSFKEWAGVIGLIATSLYTAFHVAFPKVQDFIDSRDGGCLQGIFFIVFGKPKISPVNQTVGGHGNTAAVATVLQPPSVP